MSECWNLDQAAGKNTLPLVHVAAVALVDADGRILLAQRPEDKAFGGLWEFPGGKLEPGETPEEALVRELGEELEIDTKTSCLAPLTFASHAYDKAHLIMYLYVCRVWEGDIKPTEHQQVKWVKISDLNNYPMPAADIPLIPFLRELL